MTDSGKMATIEVSVIGLNRSELRLEQYERASVGRGSNRTSSLGY